MTNYFELFGLPMSLHPDPGEVRKKYYELSARYHPDRVATEGDEAQQTALDQSAKVNEAYKALKNNDAILAHILRLNDLLADDEKNNLPAAFLGEMMDLNDLIDELDTDDAVSIKRTIVALDEQMQNWVDGIRPLEAQFDGGDHSVELLLKLKDYYFRKKYLLRIKDRIDKFAAR